MLYKIEDIRSDHDEGICAVIERVGAECGAIGEGFGPSESEVRCMSQHYGTGGSIYYIVSITDQVIGGCGISAFNGSHEVCELRKLFLLPGYRRLGIGESLACKCLDFAESKGYGSCYLDTLSSMKSAISLYKKLGFQICRQLEGAHSGCDVGMIKYF